MVSNYCHTTNIFICCFRYIHVPSPNHTSQAQRQWGFSNSQTKLNHFFIFS